MWKLINVKAENLCAFKELDYTLYQGNTTLVFGNNMDNDSQGSNGSGKSAMLEAIAIGLTGEPLRKIKMEEIINDSASEALVTVTLYNGSLHEGMEITRKLSRKAAQAIEITRYNDNGEESVVQATVSDYNKYVLDEIGLTKDDLYSNFILSRSKYQSFLSCSDREKKEIINRFSNGNIVDMGIEALEGDIDKCNNDLIDAEKKLASVEGSISAFTQQIASIKQEIQDKNLKKAERIKEYNESIANKRKQIRTERQHINECSEAVDYLSSLQEKVDAIQDKDISTAYKKIMEILGDDLSLSEDYERSVEKYQYDIKCVQENINFLSAKFNNFTKELQNAQEAKRNAKDQYEQFSKNAQSEHQEIKESIADLTSLFANYEKRLEEYQKRKRDLQSSIAELENKLAGAIKCPKCNHEFVLSCDMDIQDARMQVKSGHDSVAELEYVIQTTKQYMDDCIKERQEKRDLRRELESKSSELEEYMKNTVAAFRSIEIQMNGCQYDIDNANAKVKQVQSKIENLYDRMFDETYRVIDEAIAKHNNSIKLSEISIKNMEGAIQSYEETIAELENTTSDTIIESLEVSIAKYEKQKESVCVELQEVKDKKFSLDTQKSVFMEFKTHLANTKIAALNSITNEFLAAIGSDIQISLSGYTILKSGKIRDKISISLLRDGIDCGSFDKFSAGERARVELATILAMNKLTNITCENDKGLDLLILDEILEAVDEQGLDNIFKALNNLGITTLVVSHGNIAENYPYTVVVAKQNGVSFIERSSEND